MAGVITMRQDSRSANRRLWARTLPLLLLLPMLFVVLGIGLGIRAHDQAHHRCGCVPSAQP